MTKIMDLVAARVAVRFKKGIEDAEDYAEAGMKARIVGAGEEIEPGCYRIDFDFTEFEAENLAHEHANYYGPKGSAGPLMTAREAGCYKALDSYYADDAHWSDLFEVVDEGGEGDVLRREFLGRRDQNQGYVSWLEATARCYFKLLEVLP